MKSAQYLEEIRRSAGLRRAVLKKITVEGGEATFHLITDTNYTEEDVKYASSVSLRYAAGLRARAKILKSVPDAEAVKAYIAGYLKDSFPAFAAFLSPADITAEVDAGGGRFTLKVDPSEYAKGKGDGVVDEVSTALGRNFCGHWLGELTVSEQKEKGEITRETPPEEFIVAPRFFEICNFTAIDGADPRPTNALYIADLAGEVQGVTVCGTMSHIEERETKNGKPYFSILLSDGTGTLRASYFSKKATVEKVRALRAGTGICLTGDNEFFGGGLSFKVKSLDLGTPPEGFTPTARPSRPAPARYRCVFPQPEADLVQSDFFGSKPLPEGFAAQKYVVFDLETTGFGASTSAMDRIIEVGAVKIEGGTITERFSSFVACPVRLPPEIVELTGITDDMLKGAPDISDVIADFFKFTEGCALVAHNAQFDCRFIRYYGEKEGYLFEQRQLDTLALSQELLRLKNYKLNTVAEHYGFTFNHHRAFDDAFVTAKIFIELVRERGKLP